MKLIIHSILLCLVSFSALGQKDTLRLSTPILKAKNTEDPLAPSKAAFYSAVVPGLGQVYNKKYWKLPIVYGGMGAGLYFYFDNNKVYNQFRDIYKRRLMGYTDDAYGYLDNDRILRVQRTAQRNRDLSLVVTIGVYILNIIDANVDAHLNQFNVNDDLTLEPAFDYNPHTQNYQYGMRAVLQF